MSAMIRFSFLETVVSYVNELNWQVTLSESSPRIVILDEMSPGRIKSPPPSSWACGLFFSPCNISKQFCFITPFLSKLGKEIEKRNVVKTVEKEEKGQNLALGRKQKPLQKETCKKRTYFMVHVKRKSWGMTTLRLPYSILTLNKYEILIYFHFYSVPHD